MKITLLAFGSRGDIQPIIALALSLQKAGHTVKVATHRSFESWVRESGLDFALLSMNLMESIRSQQVQEILRKGKTPLGFISTYQKFVAPTMDAVLLDSWKACQDAEAIVASSLAFWGSDIAEALGVPYYFAEFFPVSSTSAFPHALFPPQLGRLGGWFNRLSYSLMWGLFWYIYRPAINQWRQKQLNLPPIGMWRSHLSRMIAKKTPILAAYSPNVVSLKKDRISNVYQTGYWFLDVPKDFIPPKDLVDFLEDGKPPIYIGFGSYTGGEEANKLTEIALAALKKSKQRGILLMDKEKAKSFDLPDTVFAIESIPHPWLFPKMAAVLHHCGAGTTAATIKAGVPHIPLPFMADQPFWGDRIVKLGIGTAPLSSETLTVEHLSDAMSKVVNNEEIKSRSLELGQKVANETGAIDAVAVIEQKISFRNL